MASLPCASVALTLQFRVILAPVFASARPRAPVTVRVPTYAPVVQKFDTDAVDAGVGMGGDLLAALKRLSLALFTDHALLGSVRRALACACVCVCVCP